MANRVREVVGAGNEISVSDVTNACAEDVNTVAKRIASAMTLETRKNRHLSMGQHYRDKTEWITNRLVSIRTSRYTTNERALACNSQTMSAFCACRRFSASSQMTDCGPSRTSALTSYPR